MTRTQLKRIRWAVRGALVLGIAASITANVLHAEPIAVARMIAAWPPAALLITLELIARVPVHRRGLAAVRLLATGIIGGIAAWVSYWHMAAVAQRYGETGAAPYLIPVSVDGLVVVASICLVEIAGRIREVGSEPAKLPVEVPAVQPEPAQVTADQTADAVPAEVPAPDAEPSDDDDRSAKTRKIPTPSIPRRPFAVTQRAAAAMQADGMDVPKIAEALGISARQVRNALKPVPVNGSSPGPEPDRG